MIVEAVSAPSASAAGAEVSGPSRRPMPVDRRSFTPFAQIVDGVNADTGLSGTSRMFFRICDFSARPARSDYADNLQLANP